MADFGDSQFDYLISAVADKYPAITSDDGSTQFQFSGSPEAATWKSGIDIDAYNFANKVSADCNGFYTPRPDSLYNAYSDLLSSISPGINGSVDPEYVKLMGQLNDASAECESAIDAAEVAWASYKQQNKNLSTGLPDEIQGDWLKDELGGMEYQTAIDDAVQAKTVIKANIVLLIGSFNAALAADQLKLVADENKSNYKKADGSMTRLPTITMSGDLGKDKVNWDNTPDTYDLDVTLSKDATVTTPWKTVYTTHVEQHCFSTSVTTSVSSSRIIQDNHYNLRVMCKGFKAYDVTFGDWYSGSFVNPNTAVFSPASVVNAGTFFNPLTGSLHMIPSQVWVMYQPTIVLTVSTDTYKQTIEGTLSSGISWVDILSFRFDATAGSSMAEVGETTTTITFKSPVLQGPQIFGVTSLMRVLSPTPSTPSVMLV